MDSDEKSALRQKEEILRLKEQVDLLQTRLEGKGKTMEKAYE